MKPHSKTRSTPGGILRGRRVPVLVATLGVVIALAIAAAPDFAASGTSAPASGTSAPICKLGQVFATKLVNVECTLHSAEKVLEFGVELATSRGGPWSVAYVQDDPTPGDDPTSYSPDFSLEGLTPATTYYLRGFARSVGSSARGGVFEVTTHATEAPEISGVKVAEIEGLSGEGFELGTSFATFSAAIYGGGAETAYQFEYAESESGPWSPFTADAGGTVTVAQETVDHKAKLTGLMPATKYYLRVKATNTAGTTEEIEPFQTTPMSPQADAANAVESTAASVSVTGTFKTRGFETDWHAEYTTEPANAGSWVSAPGASGMIAALAPSELGASEQFSNVSATIVGLIPSTTYYVRFVIDNGHGEATSSPASILTDGPPSGADTLAVHAIHDGALRVLGFFTANTTPADELQTITIGGSPTGGTFTLSFKGQSTEPIPFNASGASVEKALAALSTVGGQGIVFVDGNRGGPYTVQFTKALADAAQPQLTADGSGLTLSGTVTVAIAQEGLSYDTHFDFEYVSQEQFEAPGGQGGFAQATHAPEIDLGGASGLQIVGEDLPELQPGTTYHFRLTAKSNTTSEEPVLDGGEQTLTVPVMPSREAESSSCPNETLRSGPSAALPDCRAYELVTPSEKRGTMDIGATSNEVTDEFRVAEDGDHLSVHAPGTEWGPSPDSHVSNYFFSRNPEQDWQMTSATPQPEAGLDDYVPSVFSANLTEIGVEVSSETNPIDRSSAVEFELGPPGGPYTTAATIPRKDQSRWAWESADLNRAILETTDHSLLGHPSGTTSGADLYEYSEGQLRQINVQGYAGTPINTCGAELAAGIEGMQLPEYAGGPWTSNANTVSADGSRIFFTDDCTHHLYVRLDGSETLDIGEYTLLAANSQGSTLLLEHENGGSYEAFLYDTETHTAKHLFTTPTRQYGSIQVSEDLSTIYFEAKGGGLTPEATAGEGEATYRYDVATEKLAFLPLHPQTPQVSPEGRYLYFESEEGFPGLPAGSKPAGTGETRQVYRYDSVENVVECISCASPYDLEPKLNAGYLYGVKDRNGVPDAAIASADGDYVFFETPSALVPQDVDGEVPPDSHEGENQEFRRSVSSDVYEWRRPGVNGCAHLQGCVSLISGGKGGGRNTELLGTDPSGRDVFFVTHEALVPADKDLAGDVYDARIDGGFAPLPPRPVECEGDACSTPLTAPIDSTPASLSFSGAGNLAPLATQASKPKPTKPKPTKPKRRKTRPKKTAKKRAKHGSSLGRDGQAGKTNHRRDR